MSTAVALLVFASVIGMTGCSGEENEKDHTSVSEKPSEGEKIELITETAPQDGLNLQALSNGKSAVSVWKINLNEQSVAVTVWVKDAAIVCGETEQRSDGVCLYLSKASPEWGYTAGVSSKIFAAPDGTVSSYQATDAQTMAKKDFGADVKVFRWAETAGDVCGYKVAFSVPYAAIGADKTDVAIAPTLQNATYPSFDATVRTYALTEYGTDLANQNTWLVAEEDGGLILNEEPYPTGAFSYRSSVYGTEKSYWNLSEDYLESDSRYAQRKVSLNRTLGNGIYNVLNFYKAEGRLFYCESVFTLPEDPVYNFDPAPKFGIRILDSNSNGIYFYIDALVSSFTGNIIGTNAGYCPMTNGYLDWGRASSKNVGYSSDTPVQLAVFRQDSVLKLIVNGEVIFTFNGNAGFAATSETMPSVFSFNIGLILTEYRSTADASDPMIQKYMR